MYIAQQFLWYNKLFSIGPNHLQINCNATSQTVKQQPVITSKIQKIFLFKHLSLLHFCSGGLFCCRVVGRHSLSAVGHGLRDYQGEGNTDKSQWWCLVSCRHSERWTFGWVFSKVNVNCLKVIITICCYASFATKSFESWHKNTIKINYKDIVRYYDSICTYC